MGTFSEDTPLASIEALLPDVLVKGADWARTEVGGADLVEGWGGKVVLVELQPGHSTTATPEPSEQMLAGLIPATDRKGHQQGAGRMNPQENIDSSLSVTTICGVGCLLTGSIRNSDVLFSPRHRIAYSWIQRTGKTPCSGA